MARVGYDPVDASEVQSIALRLFGDRIPVAIERMEEGVSTVVYRLRREWETFYLRVLPEAGASFAPEVFVHNLLRRRGAHVPEVIYFEHCNEMLQRSVMVTTEIRGQHIRHVSPDEAATDILFEAGRELALINSIPVEGFGWIKRDTAEVTALEAEQPSNQAFMLQDLDHYLSALAGTTLANHEASAIRDLVGQHPAWLDVEQAHLAHGDFDATHIYQENGRYTGIIDLGEIRGTGPCYDLGHFRLHDMETARYAALPALLAGYQEIAPLPPDAEFRIAFMSVLIGVRFLGRSLYRLDRYTRDHACASVKRELSLLRSAV